MYRICMRVGLNMRCKGPSLIYRFLTSVLWWMVVPSIRNKICLALVQVGNMNQIIVKEAFAKEMC